MEAYKYIKQLIKNISKLIDNNIVTIENFNYLHQWTGHLSKKQHANNDLNDTLDQMDLTDIFRTFYPKAVEYTFFSRAHGTFSRIDHTLGHKSALNKYRDIEIIPCIFSDHSTMKLEINHKKKCRKITNSWRLKNILLNSEWANQEVKEEIKKYMEANEYDNTTTQNLL